MRSRMYVQKCRWRKLVYTTTIFDQEDLTEKCLASALELKRSQMGLVGYGHAAFRQGL